MFANRRRHEFLAPEFQPFWCGLSFQAGFVNTGGFLACARFVSHMTGFGTQVGISISQSDYAMAFEMFSAPASFVLGAMVSAYAIDRRVVRELYPNYLYVMAATVLIYLGVTLAGFKGLFGPFGEQLLYSRDFLLMSILCFTCGMQNACFSSLTRGQIRTTHLTGIFTDIGISFVKLFYLPPKGRETTILRRLNYVRMLTVLSFSSGAAVSAVLFNAWGYLAFSVVVVTSSVLFLTMYMNTRRRKKIRAEMLRRQIEIHAAEVESKRISAEPEEQRKKHSQP